MRYIYLGIRIYRLDGGGEGEVGSCNFFSFLMKYILDVKGLMYPSQFSASQISQMAQLELQVSFYLKHHSEARISQLLCIKSKIPLKNTWSYVNWHQMSFTSQKELISWPRRQEIECSLKNLLTSPFLTSHVPVAPTFLLQSLHPNCQCPSSLTQLVTSTQKDLGIVRPNFRNLHS